MGTLPVYPSPKFRAWASLQVLMSGDELVEIDHSLSSPLKK